jgi:hypothetical protein
MRRAVRAYTKTASSIGTFLHDEPAPPPYQRSLLLKNRGVYWTCGCGRRHRVPNVVRGDFACPNCEEVYRGQTPRSSDEREGSR